jgi:hypothetical protein
MAPDNGIRIHPDVEERIGEDLSYQHTPVDVEGLRIGVPEQTRGPPSHYESLEDMYHSVRVAQEHPRYLRKTRSAGDM